jgi:Tol biopolymer transport system component
MFRRTDSSVVPAKGFSLTDPLISPRSIAYQQSRAEDDYSQKLFIEHFDGQPARALFDDAQHSRGCPPAWSADGKTLYHSHDQIVAIDVVTGAVRTVTDFRVGEGANWFLSCSPDGRTLAFLLFPLINLDMATVGPVRFCTIGTDGRDFRVVLQEPEGCRLWRADVLWQSRQGIVSGIMPNGWVGFWKVDLDGGALARVGQEPPGAQDFQLSPDGQRIVFFGDGIAVLSLPDGQIRLISHRGTNPSWSPDGRRLAFMDGDHELWTVSAEGKNFQKLARWGRESLFRRSASVYASYSQRPLWSSDGRLLWFGLTKSHHLRNTKNPEFLQSLKARMDAGESHFGQMSASVRQRSYETSRELLHWDYQHKHGIIDFAEHRMMIGDGYWTNVAWAPE